MGKIHDTKDIRNIEIENVGITNYKLPIEFKSKAIYHSIASIKAGVSIGKNVKGAHLSRIVEVLDEMIPNKVIDLKYFMKIVEELKDRLELQNANICLTFDIIVPALTPVSKRKTFLTSEITLYGEIKNGKIYKYLSLTSNGAMLCPNSKSISKNGAHSQKCNLKATIFDNIEDASIEKVIEIIFGQFSAEVYGIVKSVDEKLLTEKAYDNPKFSEDLIRDTLLALRKEFKSGKIMVEIENLESIHQHNVYAKGILE